MQRVKNTDHSRSNSGQEKVASSEKPLISEVRVLQVIVLDNSFIGKINNNVERAVIVKIYSIHS